MQSNHPTAVLILSAGSVKNKYQSFSFLYNSPALVPIASRSSVSFIVDFYKSHPVNIYLVINKEDEPLVSKELAYYQGLNIITIENSTGVNQTLSQALKIIKEDTVVVNVVTTIPTAYPHMNTVFIENTLSASNYYSGIITDGDQTIYKFKKDDNILPFHAFTGIFHAERKSLTETVDSITNQTDLLEVVKKIGESTIINFKECEWIDTGHEINYADARKKLMSSRSFNSISVDNHLGILTKKSKEKVKLANEVNYVAMLPAALQILYPRILPGGYKEGEVMMEYYGYPNLSEYQLYRAIVPAQWKKIFDGLGYALTFMSKYKFSIGLQAFADFYYEKTINRTDEYLLQLPQDDVLITAKQLNINGLICKNYTQLVPLIKQRIQSLYSEDDFSIMHGDFCFNNILYDTFSNTIKLIDPRGSFGNNCIGIYGDRKYDIAKLLHSTAGHYDYMANNLFQYSQNGVEISYSFPLRSNSDLLLEYSKTLMAEQQAKENDIMFIVGLLFLSMCPLHRENPPRQKLMYTHGLYFINKYL